MTGTARNYARGAELERTVAEKMRARGWTVTRAAGSHGVYDLHCSAEGGRLWLVQCKTDRRTLDSESWYALFTLAIRLGGVPIIADRSGPSRAAALWVVLDERPKYAKPDPLLRHLSWAEV